MSNIRVHELAKQLGKDSKDILKILAEQGIEAKTHMSSISVQTVELVKKEFASNSTAVKKTVVKSENNIKPQQSGNVKSDIQENKEEKKSHITQVYNPHNSVTNNAQQNRKKNNSNYRNQNNNRNNNQNNNNRTNNQTSNQNNRNNNQSSNPNNRNNNQTSNQNNRNNNQSSNQNNRNNNTNSNQNSNQNNRNNNQNTVAKQNTSPNNRRDTKIDNNKGSDVKNISKNETQNTNNKSNDKNVNKNVKNNNNNYRGNRPNQRNYYNRNNRNNSNVTRVQPVQEVVKEEIKEIIIPDSLTIKELADKMKIQPSVIVKKLFLQGQIVTINQEVDFEVAQDIALQFEIIAELEEKIDIIEELLREEEEDGAQLSKRAPVVCVMGHVDHGKTSLLDAIKKTNMIEREAGGITQHIGAYTVEANGEKITFLDTPGHEAFTAMRMRGAQSTDIAILVVAADDGVVPQTIEAINHARAAGISIIVAINKIDKPSANIDKVKQELAEYELLAEDWGGQTIFVPVSAHTGEGIPSLLEMILLEAEICELKANPDRNARGLVIEAKLDKGKGPVATVLVQKGTLHIGDTVAAGSYYGKVRAMVNDKRERMDVAGPSTPVEILGLNGVPNAGEVLVATKNDKEARHFAETFIKDGREKLLEGSRSKSKMSLDDLFSQIQAGELKELNIIVKADVQGSVEAVKQSLVKLSNEEVVVKTIHAGVGAINESDVILASASNAIIIGFNVRPDNMAKEVADRENVDLRLYRVIYQAIEDIEKAMKGLLDPIYEEKIIGHSEVRQIFKSSGVGTIAGSYVLDGLFRRGCSCRITREGELIFEGPLASLKRFKDDVKEVKSNYECGLVFEKFNDVMEGDLVEAYVMEEVPR